MDYPRPQLRRADWHNLDGAWRFAYDDAGQWATPDQVGFEREILVPWAPESSRSGIGDTGFHARLWYARRVELAGGALAPGQRLVLHFGAVDHGATVWVDGQRAGTHRGGHAPFSFDITDLVGGAGFELAVLAEDDPADMHKPRGKQDWQREPHGIWYPRTSGIWRTVWLEVVNASHLTGLRWTADVAAWQIRLDAHIAAPRAGQRLNVRLTLDGRTLADDNVAVIDGCVARSVHLPDPGIDDAREHWMWSPENPQLIDATLELIDADGVVLDTVQSYTALRSVAVDDGALLLNSRPYPLRMVLDQGYWPHGLMGADSAELRRDVELTRLMGFNGARKHQKGEDPRWLYWCDVLGLCVWAEMPSAYGFSDASIDAITDEWKALVQRDLSHPCVIAWVPINESWGVPELPNAPRQVDLVRALYHLTRALDGTRPVIGNDGWEMPCGDIVAIHDYSNDIALFEQRYGDAAAVAATLQGTRPIRRKLLIAGFDGADRPAMLTEFGGIALKPDDGTSTWGYSIARNPAKWLTMYRDLLAGVHRCRGLAGFCYTQLTDTFLEQNGVLTETREPKATLAEIASATRGPALAARIAADNPMGYHPRWLAKVRAAT